MNLKYETNFAVLPIHTNWKIPLIFGGAFFSQLDLAAASCVRQVLHLSECDNAVTFKFNGTFHAPSYMGDMIYIYAEITEMRQKSITIKVEAYREPHPTGEIIEPKRIHVASAEFVFVTMKDGKYQNHGLSLNV
jgi:acyl-CoA hydrolase